MDITAVFRSCVSGSSSAAVAPSPYLLMAADILHQIRNMENVLERVKNNYVNYNRYVRIACMFFICGAILLQRSDTLNVL